MSFVYAELVDKKLKFKKLQTLYSGYWDQICGVNLFKNYELFIEVFIILLI